MSDQNKLALNAERIMESVEDYKFEPIKGYPMLYWKGKRPFTSTQYYPAQLKETYGEEVNSWINKIFWGDNLQIMSHLVKEYRGKISLVYIDPPFDSKADYKKKIKLKGKDIENDQNSFEEKQYTDIWNNDEYLQFMYERLILMRELLSDEGNIIVHVDYRKGPYLKCILDEIFGVSAYKNELIWHYSGWIKASSNQFGRKHDTLYFYSKTDKATFNITYESWVDKFTLKELKSVEIFNSDLGDYFELEDKRYYLKEILDDYIKNRKQAIFVDENGEYLWADGRNTVKRYLKDVLKGGRAVDDVWNIKALTTSSKERVGYPTQKPGLLLERIIEACTNKGEIVFDCFMGGGTTQATALKLGRKFIGADINLGAIESTIKRLNIICKEIKSNPQELFSVNENGNDEKVVEFYTGFELYNVNNYDVFRNPVQAKEILKQALEIQPLPNNTIYDGEKDGKMVKIMPVNRIATRADLNELITGFNYKEFERKYEKFPNQSVENLMLICMGHEPDLAATLQKEVHPYKMEIEVVDILRDKTNLEFKRDSVAEVIIEKNELKIKNFFPMNLLQKLSIDKEKIDNWKELTESIKIDFNYDGSVFEPSIIDVPEGNEFVKGIYIVPNDAGNIKIKITDILSESLEMEVKNG